MAKTNKKPIVRIKKLRAYYELKFDFDKMLQAYIKSLPKEHRKTDKVSYIDNTGKVVDEWIRSIREVQIGNIISFLIDNNYEFVLENFTKDEMARLRGEYLERQKRMAEALRIKAESISVTDDDYSFMKVQPYGYQKQGVKFFEINNGNCLLGDQPGIGKTMTAIAYAAKNKLKTLVICPSSLKLMWRNEILKFTNEKCFVYKYNPTKKSKNINYSKEESLFHVINFESIQSYIKLEYKHVCQGMIFGAKGQKKCGTEIIDLTKKHTECPNCKNKNPFKTRVKGVQFFSDKNDLFIDADEYGLLVIDEFHRIKEKKTDWTQIILNAFRDEISKKILLSGTAIKSRPMELFTPLNLVDKENWNSRHDFGVRYCAGYEDNFGWVYDGASNLEELYERISPIYLRRLKKDVLPQLPEKTFTDIPVEMNDKQRAKYSKLESAKKKVIKDGVEGEEDKGYLEKIHELKKFTEEIKLESAQEFIDDICDSGDKIVLFFDYIDTAKKIKELWGDRAVIHTGEMSETEKFSAVESFQTKKNINVFGGTIMSAGVGITLTAANKLIFIGQGWTPADMEQCSDRVHRATTTHDNVQIIKYLVEDTIDPIIHNMLNEKSQVVSKVLDNKDFKSSAKRGDNNILKELIEKIKQK